MTAWIASQVAIYVLEQDGLSVRLAQVLMLLAAPAIGAVAVLKIQKEPKPVRSPAVIPYVASFTLAGVTVGVMAYWGTLAAPNAEWSVLPLLAIIAIVAVAAFALPAVRFLVELFRTPAT